MTTRPVAVRVSQATRLEGSSARQASRMASEIWSAILSGWPSVTDSEVNRMRFLVVDAAKIFLLRKLLRTLFLYLGTRGRGLRSRRARETASQHHTIEANHAQQKRGSIRLAEGWRRRNEFGRKCMRMNSIAELGWWMGRFGNPAVLS